MHLDAYNGVSIVTLTFYEALKWYFLSFYQQFIIHMSVSSD